VHAVEARSPVWPFENTQTTDEAFKVLLQNERFAQTKRAFAKEKTRKPEMSNKTREKSSFHVGHDQNMLKLKS
jgi:hypothetical protein